MNAPAEMRRVSDAIRTSRAADALRRRLPWAPPPPPPRWRRMSRVVAGPLAGALAAFFLDPQHGRRRRRAVTARAVATARRAGRAVRRRERYIAGRIEGVKQSVKPRITKDHDDQTLKHKIESEVVRGFDGAAVNVSVDMRVATLHGEMAHPEDIRALVAAVEEVPGVVRVISHLHMPKSPAPNKLASLGRPVRKSYG